MNTVIGPFDSLPFVPWTKVSPMMTRLKKGSIDCRVIVDLSFSQGADVNSGLDIDCFLGYNHLLNHWTSALNSCPRVVHSLPKLFIFLSIARMRYVNFLACLMQLAK